MSDKTTLAPGQQSAEYFFEANSFEELGAKLDEFYQNLDYAAVRPSSSIDVRVSITSYRAYRGGQPLRTVLGSIGASVAVDRRGVGE